MSQQIEKAIREKRTIDATKNNLMGITGKLVVIATALGTPIIRQGSSLYDVSYMDNYDDDGVFVEYSSTLSGGVPVAHRDEIIDSNDNYIVQEGLLFDGLSRGLHMEITYWTFTNELKMYHKGHLVYHEIAGELESYAPNEEWEKQIDRLYASAKGKLKIMRAEEELEIGEKIMRKKDEFWQYIKSKWGSV